MTLDIKKHDHENIVVEESRRNKLLRQDRLFLLDRKVKLKTENESYEIIDCSSFGLAIQSIHNYKNYLVSKNKWKHSIGFSRISQILLSQSRFCEFLFFLGNCLKIEPNHNDSSDHVNNVKINSSN
jgi:hypothetical protein